MGKESLRLLILSNNSLTKLHRIPWEGIYYLNYHGNLLEGELPIAPVSTSFFSLSRNHLSGDVPSSICDLQTLEVLDLSYNNLSGKVPHCLVDLNWLSVLNIRMKRFEGTLPESFGTTLRSLNFNGNSLKDPCQGLCSNVLCLKYWMLAITS